MRTSSLSDDQIADFTTLITAAGCYVTPVFEADGRVIEIAAFKNGELAGTVCRAKGGGVAIWTPEREAKAADVAEAARLIPAWSNRRNTPKNSRGKSAAYKQGIRRLPSATGVSALTAIPHRVPPLSLPGAPISVSLVSIH